jgi:hypothetical protein
MIDFIEGQRIIDFAVFLILDVPPILLGLCLWGLCGGWQRER